ncbi:MAG: RNA polymerase sigma factor [Saprospiraceae bacterium]
MKNKEFVNQITTNRAKLLGFAMKLTRNQEDANDLMQETVYRAFKNLNSFQPNSNFKAWISMIMRNTFINKYRKDKRRFNHENDLEQERKVKLKATVNNHGESNKTVEELTGLINQLKDDLKRPFLLRYSGYKYDEISEELGIPLGTVKSQIFYAKKKLRIMIKETYAIKHFSEIAA